MLHILGMIVSGLIIGAISRNLLAALRPRLYDKFTCLPNLNSGPSSESPPMQSRAALWFFLTALFAVNHLVTSAVSVAPSSLLQAADWPMWRYGSNRGNATPQLRRRYVQTRHANTDGTPTGRR